MLNLSQMRDLAGGAEHVSPVSRAPVKTHFTDYERGIVKDFFSSLCPPRISGSMRMRTFFALCDLLGKRLDASSWHCLEDANKVGTGGLHFFVGKRPVKSGNDWELKCLGLKEVEPRVFVVGLNQLFFDKAGVRWVDRLPPDVAPDVSALAAQVEAKEGQRTKMGSNREHHADTPLDDRLIAKQDIAALKSDLDALDTKIQLLLDVISFDRFMKHFQNPENTEATKDLLMDLVSEGVTDDPGKWLVDRIGELEARLGLATTWSSSEPSKSKDSSLRSSLRSAISALEK